MDLEGLSKDLPFTLGELRNHLEVLRSDIHVRRSILVTARAEARGLVSHHYKASKR